MRFDRLTELRQLWYRVDLAIKLPGDWVKALKPDIDGLKTAMRQRINVYTRHLSRSGLNLATLYHADLRNRAAWSKYRILTPKVESEPIYTKSFEDLGSPTKADIRLIACLFQYASSTR